MVSELNLGGKEGLILCSWAEGSPPRKEHGACERGWREVHWASSCRLLKALEPGSHVTRAGMGSQMGWGTVTRQGTGVWP